MEGWNELTPVQTPGWCLDQGKEVLPATAPTLWLSLCAGRGPRCSASLTHQLLEHSATSPIFSPIHRGAYPVMDGTGQLEIQENNRGRLL